MKQNRSPKYKYNDTNNRYLFPPPQSSTLDSSSFSSNESELSWKFERKIWSLSHACWLFVWRLKLKWHKSFFPSFSSFYLSSSLFPGPENWPLPHQTQSCTLKSKALFSKQKLEKILMAPWSPAFPQSLPFCHTSHISLPPASTSSNFSLLFCLLLQT